MIVGLIGCGIVGSHLGARLLRAGHELEVHDLNRDRARRLTDAGARWVASPGLAVERSGLAISALPGPAETESVFLGDDGAWSSANPGLIHLDTSTIGPECALGLAGEARSRKVSYLAAPLSRGVLTERGPRLVMWIGGDADAFDEIRPVLDVLADQVAWCGGPGHAQVTKLVNNLVTQSLGLILGEALTLGVGAGVPLEILRGALHQGTAQNRLLDEMLPLSAFREDWRPGLRLDHAVKDLRLATDLAGAGGATLPLARRALAEYERALERGWGDLSCHAVVRLAEEVAGVTLRSMLPDQPRDDEEPLG